MTITTRPRLRQRGPSEAEWAHVKPEIQRLYLYEQRQLKEIMQIMAVEHDFHARAYMYKTRFKLWGFRKSFKNDERLAAARIWQPFLESGLKAPVSFIAGREVPFHRVRRHNGDIFSRKGMKTYVGAICKPSSMSVRPKAWQVSGRGQSGRQHNIPRVLLQQSDELRGLESALVQLNNYYVWRLHQADDHFLAGTIPQVYPGSEVVILRPRDIFKYLNLGIALLSEGTAESVASAKTSIGHFFSQIGILLNQQHPRFIDNLLFLMNRTVTHVNYKVHESVLLLIYRHARSLLGNDHPVTLILQLAQSGTMRGMACQSLTKLMINIAGQQRNQQAVFDHQSTMLDLSIDHDDFDTAAGLCRRFLEQYLHEFGEKSDGYRLTLQKLGYLHYQHVLHQEAEEIFLHVLELDGCYIDSARDADRISAGAMKQLGWISEDSGDFYSAKIWYSKTYEARCTLYGSKDPRTLESLRKLGNMLSLSGGDSGLAEQTRDGGSVEQESLRIVEELDKQIMTLGLEETSAVLELKTPALPWNQLETEKGDNKDNRGTARVLEPLEQSKESGHGQFVERPLKAKMNADDNDLLLDMNTTDYEHEMTDVGNSATGVMASWRNVLGATAVNHDHINDEDAGLDALPELSNDSGFDDFDIAGHNFSSDDDVTFNDFGDCHYLGMADSDFLAIPSTFNNESLVNDIINGITDGLDLGIADADVPSHANTLARHYTQVCGSSGR